MRENSPGEIVENVTGYRGKKDQPVHLYLHIMIGSIMILDARGKH